MDLRIRAGTPDDLSAIAAIEAASFPKGDKAEQAWTEESLRTELERPHTRLHVAENGTVVGYCLLWLVVDEAEILTLAVDPAKRKQGIGTELLEGVMRDVAHEGANSMYLDVRESNYAGIALYRNAGFIQIGERKRYYDGKENALVLKRKLNHLRANGS